MIRKFPHGWASAPLTELGTWLGGGTPSKSVRKYWENGTVHWVSPKDMKRLLIDSSEDQITPKAVEESATNLIPTESVLMVTRSGILEHSFPVAVNTVAVAINQDLKAWTPFDGIDPLYAAYFLKAQSQRILETCSKDGTTVSSIDFDRLAAYEMPIAPNAEQRRIVSKIDELFSRIDEGERALEQVQKLAERYRQSVLKAAITGELTREWRERHKGELEPGEALLARILRARRAAWEKAELAKMKAKGIRPVNDEWKRKYQEPIPVDATDLTGLPEGWTWASIDQLCSLITSGSRGWKKYYANSGSVFIRAQNIKHDRLDLDDVAFVDIPGATEGTRTKVSKGDLLVTITGANVTKSALVEVNLDGGYVSQHVALLRFVSTEISKFVFYSVVSPANGRARLLDAAYGAGKPGLSLEDLKQLPIALPSIQEQRWICEQLAVGLERLGDLVADAATQSRAIFGLRQSILDAAFSGALIWQDPADEPAASLLEGIAKRSMVHRPALTRDRRKELHA